MEIADSPNIGVCLCVGCWLEGGDLMGKNVLETIQYFGGLKKLFVVHLRNVHAPLPYFRETFLNEGYIDMYKIMKALRRVNFAGVLIADHWPNSNAGSAVSQAYTIGYIQALIERANEEVHGIHMSVHSTIPHHTLARLIRLTITFELPRIPR